MTHQCDVQDTCTFDEACPFWGSCIKVLPEVTSNANPVIIEINVAEQILDESRTIRPVAYFTATVDATDKVMTFDLPATPIHPDASKTRLIRISVKRRTY